MQIESNTKSCRPASPSLGDAAAQLHIAYNKARRAEGIAKLVAIFLSNGGENPDDVLGSELYDASYAMDALIELSSDVLTIIDKVEFELGHIETKVTQ